MGALLFPALFLVCICKGRDDFESADRNARIDIRIEGSTLRLPAKDIFRWVRSAR